MRIQLLLLGLLTSLVLFGFTANAQWYEAQGHASLEKYSLNLARAKATENALKKALLVAGASVSSVQQVVNGLLTQDQLNIRASGNVNSIELIDEFHSNNTITVRIRADIYPQEKQCFSIDLKKSILLTKSHLSQREQASIGNIYPINHSFIKKLNQHMLINSNFSHPKLLLNSSTAFARLNQSLQTQEIKQLAITLANSSDSQYVLFSEIDDISLTQQRTNTWQVWQQGAYPRNFNVTLYLYNGLNGEQVWQQSYQNSAVWSFNKRAMVDVHSSVFWQSEYGNMLMSLLDKAVKDLDEHIMCEPSEGKLLQVTGNQVVINLGRHHGVKIGDEFSLIHLNNFVSDSGKLYASHNVSAYKVKVTKLTKQSATAVTLDNELLGNIQINDLAVRF